MSEHSEQNAINRSSALTPEALAMINSATAMAVQEAVKGVFANLIPVLKDMALTPEKLREANKPYEDPKKVLRDARESLKSKMDAEDAIRVTAARKAQCPHLDENQRTSIRLVHNYYDHQPRGVCVICGDWIHPKEWRIDADADLVTYPRGKAYLVAAHKDYRIVSQLESRG